MHGRGCAGPRTLIHPAARSKDNRCERSNPDLRGCAPTYDADEAERELAGQRARRSVEENYRWGDVAAAHVRLYRSVARSAG